MRRGQSSLGEWQPEHGQPRPTWRLTQRGWVALLVLVALLAAVFVAVVDALWLNDGATAEQEATWLR